MIKFFKKKTKEEPVNHIDKVIPISHGELIIRFNKITGITSVINFKTPLMAKNVYPKCWLLNLNSKNKINLEFEDILKDRIPYDTEKLRIKYLSDMNDLINIFHRSFSTWDVDDSHIKQHIEVFLINMKDWEYAISILSIYMECTVKWLRLQEEKFNDLHDPEPELKLTDEEYEAILSSMKRFNP